MHKKELLKERDNTTSKETKIPLVLTYCQSLPNISKVVRNILSINKAFKEIFQNELVTAFRRNKNLKELIGSNKIEPNKVKKYNSIMKKSKCSPCSANKRTLCCKQVISSLIIKSQQINKCYTILHQVNCSSSYVISLMECTLCKKPSVRKTRNFVIIFQKLFDVISSCKHLFQNFSCKQQQPKLVGISSLLTRSNSYFHYVQLYR